ncbi:MAG: polysaccharide deacetylase family protein [Candidatus Ozemobacteraceae bacterium]
MNKATLTRLLIIHLLLGVFLVAGGILGIVTGWTASQSEILLVTAFHGITDSPTRPWEIESAALDRILDNFHRHSYESLPPERFSDWRSGNLRGGRRFLMTFDDGLSSSGECMRRLKKERGIESVLFVVTDLLGKPGYLSRNDLISLASEGATIGLHGKRHEEVPALIASGVDISVELTEARKDLELLLGKPVTWYAYPFGVYNASAALAVASAGFSQAFTIDGSQIKREANPMTLPRLMYLRGAEKAGEPVLDDWFPPPVARTGGMTIILGFFILLIGARFLLRARMINTHRSKLAPPSPK